MSDSKKILIAGGAGFLGSHLTERLLAQGHYVICLDNLYSSSMNNINHLISNNNFEFIRHDVVDPINLEVDQIYNLASPASPIHYQRKPITTITTNVIGSLNLLELAKRNNAKIFQASTSEVYGDPLVHPQSEKYWGNVNSVGPRSCYDEGKRCAETLFFEYNRQHKVDIRIVRIFNTYGPRMDPRDGRVISNFIMQALSGQDITIYGDGSQTRSFCFVDDLIEGFIRFMMLESSSEKNNAFCGPLNLGNPSEFTIKQLAELVIALTDSKSRIVYLPLPQDDPLQRKPVIDKANYLLSNWYPTVELEDGLILTINYFKQFF
jgi:UDP-glucuronate decarboxylase